ncbi:MAG: DUF551 domain-containing protein [Desulfobacterales bacterium]|nr:DUF551 domain-containing protein [Desulfobacterales bacterium]
MNILEYDPAGKEVNLPNGLYEKNIRIEERGISPIQRQTDRASDIRWRRVEDELPERNEVVLICFRNGRNNSLIRTMGYRTFDPGKNDWSTDLVYEEPDGYLVDDIEVTHWMPLPEIPSDRE